MAHYKIVQNNISHKSLEDNLTVVIKRNEMFSLFKREAPNCLHNANTHLRPFSAEST
jgi:hypothetical protein